MSINNKIGPRTTFLISSQAASAATFMFSHTSDIISIKGANISTNASTALFQTSFIHSHTAIAASTIASQVARSEEHTSELQSRGHLVCRLLLEKKII